MVRSAGGITIITGGILVAAAWWLGALAMPASYAPIGDVLAEILACVCVILAWRFRRSRLALAAVAVAIVNVLVRGPLASQLAAGSGRELAALAILLPLNLGVLTLLRDRGMAMVGTLVHLLALLVQPGLVIGLLLVARTRGSTWEELLRAPQASLLAILIATAFAMLAFAVRRGAFEGAMLWVLVATAAALLGVSEPSRAALLLASAQLALLVGAVEDSYRLAYHDELTGLLGRRALNDVLRSLGAEYALAMVDVDHFKRFNDRWGHETGDQALRMVADSLRSVGGGGRAFRYGGEEFAVVFPGQRAVAAREHLESLRRAIAKREFAIRSPKRPRKRPESPRPETRPIRRVGLTVSIGVAGPGVKRPTPEDVLRAADRALYRAKRKGRNRLVMV